VKKLGFLEEGETQDLQNVVEAPFELEFLFHDRHEDVDTDGNPDLCFHGVLGGAVEAFDTQVLLDPFEEEFYLPAALVQLGYGNGLQHEIVGEKDQPFAGRGIDKLDSPKAVRILGLRLGPCEYDGLIAAQTGVGVDGTLRPAAALEVLLGARDEESHVLLKNVEAGEIDVASVHDIEGARLQRKMIESVHVVHLYMLLGRSCLISSPI